ncbi:MAG: flagellar biosynthesis protein FlhB [Gammaproteobacteria bacterium]|nr:flagellar biosynthesis protein FlhB [Gammaproteobacteria bacterium]
MAENADGQEKSEDPTGRRIEQARQKGQVPRSREFNTFFMMIASAATLMLLGDELIRDLMAILIDSLSPERIKVFDDRYMSLVFQEQILEGLWAIVPFFAVMIAVAFISSLSIGGWNFSLQAMQPKFSKMNPISGIKRIFGVKGLIELLKAIGKVTLVGAAAVALLYWQANDILSVGYQSLRPALKTIGEDLTWFFLILSSVLIVIAAIDAPFQLWDNKKQLMMTKEEVKQEHKQTEGSPETKSRIRQVQFEMHRRRMMAEVPTADVVITNPTHFAVALKYDDKRGGAPIVVAKGADLIAAQIREIARANSVPLLSSPALARAIYYSTEVSEEIPSGLYVAVAKVLAYIFDLRRRPGTDFSKPITLEDVPIPDDLRRDH